jgi:hypothetical protein
MSNFKKTLAIVLFLLVASNIVWALEYISQRSELIRTKGELSTVVQNKKILAFQKLFVEKVLNADGVVDFNTRVTLQNAVADINDESITRTWNGFLSAKTEAEGQNRVKQLLSLLASKAYVK